MIWASLQQQIRYPVYIYVSLLLILFYWVDGTFSVLFPLFHPTSDLCHRYNCLTPYLSNLPLRSWCFICTLLTNGDFLTFNHTMFLALYLLQFYIASVGSYPNSHKPKRCPTSVFRYYKSEWRYMVSFSSNNKYGYRTDKIKTVIDLSKSGNQVLLLTRIKAVDDIMGKTIPQIFNLFFQELRYRTSNFKAIWSCLDT